MPINNWHDISELAIDSAGVVSKYRQAFWASSSFDSNFTFGHFNLVMPSQSSSAKSPGLMNEVIHRESGLKAKFADGLEIPVEHIGVEDG